MTKLEEIARAIRDNCPAEAGLVWWLPAARAALKTARDATMAQYAAGIVAFQDPKNRHEAVLDEVWQAMIDAILNESPEAR